MALPLEEKLIFLCSRIKISPSRQKEIKHLLSSSLNWSRVLTLASIHAISPLLYTTLKKTQFLIYLDKETLSFLKNAYLNNLVRNICLWKELSSVICLLKKSELDVLVFKGAILSQTIYHDPALRCFADIDLLIKKEDLEKIKNLLLERGYREIKQRLSFLFTKLIAPDIHSCLELHTALVPSRPYHIFIPRIWQRQETKFIFGQEVAFLSKEDTFISLALHIRRHTRSLPLRFICDIRELLNLYKDKLDWEYIRDLAGKNHIKNSIYFCLYISQELLGNYVSEEIINQFAPKFLTRRLIRCCENKSNFLKPRIWQGYILRLLLFDRLLDLFVYLWRMINKKRS